MIEIKKTSDWAERITKLEMKMMGAKLTKYKTKPLLLLPFSVVKLCQTVKDIHVLIRKFFPTGKYECRTYLDSIVDGMAVNGIAVLKKRGDNGAV